MKIVVIGGTGLIGSKLVAKLAAHGHEAVPASPGTGVNTLTGEGLAEALTGADVVVDVSNSPSFEDTAVLEFFETSTRNILDAEAAAGVGHHVALSVVGAERQADSGYMRAKIAHADMVRRRYTRAAHPGPRAGNHQGTHRGRRVPHRPRPPGWLRRRRPSRRPGPHPSRPPHGHDRPPVAAPGQGLGPR